MIKRLAVARECLRQIWQTFDAGGHSLGRSQEAVWLEGAMRLLGQDHQFSNLADIDPEAFLKLMRDEVHKVSKKEMEEQDKAMFEEHDKNMGFKPA